MKTDGQPRKERRMRPGMLLLSIITLTLGMLGLSQGMRLEYAEIGADTVYHDESTEVNQSSARRQLGFLAYGTLGVYLLARTNKYCRPNRSIVALAIAIVLYIFLSFAWSDAPTTTVKRTILIGCVAVGGFGIGKTVQGSDLFRVVITCSTCFLAFGILAELYYGTLFRGSGLIEYRFSGVFHPARQAFNCGMLILACAALYATNPNRLLLLLACVAVVFLIQTKARTGTVALAVSLIYFCWSFITVRHAIASFVVGGLVLALGLLWIASGSREVDVLAITKMGREGDLTDPTKLTGRLPIWEKALSDFLDRPILGHGYGAFWLPERVNEFERLNGWAFSHAHSMYIESLVNLGVIGFLLGLLVVLFTVQAARSMQRNGLHPIAGRFVISIFMFASLAGFTESAFVGDGYEIMVATICIGFVAFHSGALLPGAKLGVSEHHSIEAVPLL